MNDVVRVAPREITDVVFRASRVIGCEASVAERISADVQHSEVQHGSGLCEFLQLVEDDPADVGRAAGCAVMQSERTPALFRRRTEDEPTAETVRVRQRALAHGLDVEAEAWNRINRIAAGFLLSEAVLDQADTN